MGSVHKTLHPKEQNPINGNGIKDRLSELSEPILQHILSYLELKQQARTSTLARQWRYTWTGVPILRIDQNQFKNPDGENQSRKHHEVKKFRRTIDHVMNHDTTIDTLHLAISTFCDNNAVNLWILRAIRRNVREVKLSIVNEENGTYEFPTALFFCKALKSLQMESFLVDALPVFASIESLSFVYIEFGDHPSISMSFSRFPCLKKLSLSYCDAVPRVVIKAPALKSLEIEGSFGLEKLSIFAPELEELSLKRWSGTTIENSTPKLKLLEWIDSGFIGTSRSINRTSVVLHFKRVLTPGSEDGDGTC